MALITIRQLDGTAIQSLSRLTPAGSYTVKRGTTGVVGVQFADENGNVVIFPVGAVVTLGIKPPNPTNIYSSQTPAFDGPYAISGTTSAAPDANGIYWLSLNLSNASLNALLGYNPPTINDDVAVINLFAEVAWSYYGGTVVGKSVTFGFVVTHDINTGLEGASTAVSSGSNTSTYVNNWSNITALSGAGANGLDAALTKGVLSPGTVVLLENIPAINAGGATMWQLQARNDATAAGLQRPADFDAVLNAVVWTKIL